MSLNVVQEFSKESIKPSSPTPDNLKTFSLSLLDQVSPPIYTPIVLFYAPTAATSDVNKSDKLKKSLSETLTRFYPIAGRIKGNNNMFVECNNEGIDYIEARAEGSVSSFMKRDALEQLLPANIDLHARGLMDNDPQSIVKVTFFGDGGMAICICFSHKITDTSTFTSFLNSWASIARRGTMDDNENTYPIFESAVLYPPRKETPTFSSTDEKSPIADHGADDSIKVSTRRLVFDAHKIAALQAKYADPSDEKKYTTRVMAVSTLLWKTAMAASSSKMPCMAFHAVNLRKRMNPPLLPQSFGHMVVLATTSPLIKESVTSDTELAYKLKDAVSNIDTEYVRALQSDEGASRIEDSLKMAMGSDGNMDIYAFSSWCGFPLYEVDFGWGKPIWVTSCASKPIKNFFILTDSNSAGDGIEVFSCLVDEEMTIFERDQELLEYVSFLD